MSKEEKYHININLEADKPTQFDLYNEALKLIETEQIKKPKEPNKNLLDRKKEAISNSIDSNQQCDHILGNNMEQDFGIWSKPETELPDTYFKERESADKRKSKDHLLEANLDKSEEPTKKEPGSKQFLVITNKSYRENNN